jgi:hypothetical protein
LEDGLAIGVVWHERNGPEGTGNQTVFTADAFGLIDYDLMIQFYNGLLLADGLAGGVLAVFALDGHAGRGNDGDVQLGNHRHGNGTDSLTDFVAGGVMNLKASQLAGFAASAFCYVRGDEQPEFVCHL